MKMNQTLKNLGVNIIPGMVLKGKWHKKRYVVRKKLGSGAIGSVYLCDRNNKPVAIKLSRNGSSMMSEVNVLKALGKVQGKKLGPSLLDVDDWVAADGTTITFYVMEYVHGVSMSSYIHKHGREWVGVFILQLLEDLEALHRSGWVFGDLKTENLLVTSPPARARWIDVGGTTQIGRSIKEYTAFYDRAYWEAGSRRADPGYDLFALVLTILHIHYPKRFSKGTDPKQTLLGKLRALKPLHVYYRPFKKAIEGAYTSSSDMKEDIKQSLYHDQKRNRYKRKTSSGHPVWMESAGIILIASGYYMMSILL